MQREHVMYALFALAEDYQELGDVMAATALRNLGTTELFINLLLDRLNEADEIEVVNEVIERRIREEAKRKRKVDVRLAG